MADDGLSVDIANPTDDESDDVVYVEKEADSPSDDAYIGKDEAGLNSPKAKNGGYDAEPAAGMGMSLNLGDSDDEEDQASVTPNTKNRDKMGINSPRNKGSQKFGDGSSDGVSSLVTQVDRPAAGGGGVESLMTQVQRPTKPEPKYDDTEDNLRQTQKPDGGGMCACFSCLFNCCSGPQPPEPVPMVSTSEMGNNQYSQPQTTQMAGDGDGKQTATKPTNPNSRLLDQKEESVSTSTEYPLDSLLPDLKPSSRGKKCLVLDLDETLVHSSFKPIPKPDFIIPVEIDRVVHHVYVLKRPYVDEFLLRTSKHYEIVIFTASLSKYADPLLDKLDIHNVIEHRLFRESCVIHGTAYVKDLRKIGRKLKDSIIVDNSPPSYLFQPTNAVPITSWFDDETDTQLLDFLPVLETTMDKIDDVRKLLDANNKSFRWLCNQANQPLTKYVHKNVNTFKY